MSETASGPKIVTFYSYKGGTGRSMALANVAWILAGNGHRVIVIDWDLEAPGLHRYFHPYLKDAELTDSTGIIDFVMAYGRAAIKPGKEPDKTWYVPYANLLRHASSLRYEFPKPGTLDFIPAGRQGVDYPARVNSFNWSAFYEKQQGGLFLEAAKLSLADYDYVLIDSRTGVSDTSGICTVQMPHLLVVCFTPNSQSIEGASAVARSADLQRTRPDGQRTLTVLPVMTRVLQAEKDRVDAARATARRSFDPLLWHIAETQRDEYWGRMSVPQEPFYAFEEVLSVFADETGQANTMLSSMETLAGYIQQARAVPPTELPAPLRLPRLTPETRQNELRKYIRFSIPKPLPPQAPLPGVSIVVKSKPQPKFSLKRPQSRSSEEYLFYFSYAARDNSAYLEQFFKDLSQEAASLAGLGQSAPVGFMDLQAGTLGQSWPDSVAQALGSARSFVALLSPAYVASSYCGKEWQAFTSRDAEAARNVEARTHILPVVWLPFRSRPPDPVARIQLASPADPKEYEEQGLLYLLRLQRNRNAYFRMVNSLAERLVDLAQSPPPPMDPLQFDAVPNAFAMAESEAARGTSGLNLVRLIAIVAPRYEMETVRIAVDEVYGAGAAEWTPFRSGSLRSATLALAGNLGIDAAWVAPPTPHHVPVTDDPPAVIVLDAWALKLVEYMDAVSDLQSRPVSGVRFMVIIDDMTNSQEDDMLTDLVRKALGDKLLLSGRVEISRSNAEFEARMGQMLERARLEWIIRGPLPRRDLVEDDEAQSSQ